VPPEIKAARPTFTLDGQPAAELSGGLVELRVEEGTAGLYSCEATFANWGPVNASTTGFLLFDRRKLDFGKELVVNVGSDELFRGRVSALEAAFPEGHPPTLTVLVEDRVQDLRMKRRSVTYADRTDADIFRQIAQSNNLTPDVDISGPHHKHVYQHNSSDLAFLRERALATDAELWVTETTLKVRAHPARPSETVTLSYGSELFEFTVIADLSDQVSTLQVTSWDVEGKQTINERSGDSSLGAELGSDQSGSSILATALQQRTETVDEHVPPTSDEAKAYADSLFKRRARRFVVGRGLCSGNAKLRAGVKVTLQGLGPIFTGDYYVAEALHLFDQVKGYRTEFHVERPGIGRAAA
jgi:Bacteriophage probable baseplate hub protein